MALDTPDARRALDLVHRLSGRVGGFKIGLELFASHGPDVVLRVREHGEVFLDLKLHDIPNTVAGAAAAIGRLGARYFTLHAGGGARMIRAGVEASAEAARVAGRSPPSALAVTVLTSHDDASLESVGVRGPCSDAVLRLAALARDAGAAGLVCSAAEVVAARRVLPDGILVVPGIRPAGAAVPGDDQARTATPRRVVEMGADLLVVGRPITGSSDPAAAAEAVAREIGSPSGDGGERT